MNHKGRRTVPRDEKMPPKALEFGIPVLAVKPLSFGSMLGENGISRVFSSKFKEPYLMSHEKR
jgi:hypothetical protein